MYCCSCLVWFVVVVFCIIVVVWPCVLLLSSYVYFLYCVCFAVFTLDAGLLARSQYSEGPATGHLDTGFSWFPCVYKQMLRWFPTFQVATTCFSCSPPDLNLVVTKFMFCLHVKLLLPPGNNPIAVNKYYTYIYIYIYIYISDWSLWKLRRFFFSSNPIPEIETLYSFFMTVLIKTAWCVF